MLTWIEISKKNLLYNSGVLRKAIGNKTQLMTVVKSFAYGHGMLAVANVLKEKTDWFGVASLDEALVLRKSKINNPILVLSYFDLDWQKIEQGIKQKITFPAYSRTQIEFLNSIAKKLHRQASVHIKIDTGTSRIGQRIETIRTFLRELSKFKNVEVSGLFSHFADSEENPAYTAKQIEIFEKAIEITSREFPNLICHMSCSAAAILLPKSHYGMVRAGLMTYGIHPSKKTRQAPITRDYVGRHIELKPVLTWKTKIIQVKSLPKGVYVGYGLSYRTFRETKMAVLPVGYADGYDRKLSNTGVVLVSGKRANVIGRVCMNLTMIDVTGIPVKKNQEVILLGGHGKNRITAEELAVKIGTINYEVVTRINWALPRIIA